MEAGIRNLKGRQIVGAVKEVLEENCESLDVGRLGEKMVSK